MWAMFAGSVLVGVLFLLLPGFLFLRSFSLSYEKAIACAPLVTIPLYIAFCLINEYFGIESSWMTIGLPPLLLALLASGGVLIVKRGSKGHSSCRTIQGKNDRSFLFDKEVALYLSIGIGVSSIGFAYFLADPNSFSQAYDNIYHLGVVRGFVETGNWSPFSATLYISASDSAINPLPGSGFYPTAWHCVSSLIVSACGVSIQLAANATNYLFIAIVLPLGSLVLMRSIFSDNTAVIRWGSVCVLAFSGFPWMLLFFGPLYPNMIAMCVVPSVCACFIDFFKKGVSVSDRLKVGMLFGLGLVSCAFMQPNAVFTAAVFLAPFCVKLAVRFPVLVPAAKSRLRFYKICSGLVACLVIVLIWFLMYKAPFLQSVVGHSWAAALSKTDAIMSAFNLGFRASGAQIILAALVILGGLYTLRNREYIWLSFSYAIICAIYAVSASSDGLLQHVLAGFWYTDSFRVAASASLFAVPLAALGLWLVSRAGIRCMHSLLHHVPGRVSTLCISSVIAVVFVWFNCLFCLFFPRSGLQSAFLEKSAFASVMEGLQGQYNGAQPRVYDESERAFVEYVEGLLPEDALVLNIPDDGSAFAYGVDGLRVYYRNLREYDVASETSESKLIREGLAGVSSNQEVKDAVEKIGAQYFISLDQGESRYTSPRLFTYENGEKWTGMDSIDDDTPGFEVVYERDDMRLYRITAVS